MSAAQIQTNLTAVIEFEAVLAFVNIAIAILAILALSRRSTRPALASRSRSTLMEPICGCEHHWSYHQTPDGHCGWIPLGAYVPLGAYDAAHCGCAMYYGPPPVPGMWDNK